VNLLYFAWVRQKIGKSEERITLPAGIANVDGLVVHLKSLGPAYADAFENIARLRVAVNQRHTNFDAAIVDGDEVAFFPPVTGG